MQICCGDVINYFQLVKDAVEHMGKTQLPLGGQDFKQRGLASDPASVTVVPLWSYHCVFYLAYNGLVQFVSGFFGRCSRFCELVSS